MQIRIIFDTQFNLVIKLFQNDFVHRWASLLKNDLEKSSVLQIDTYSSLMSEEQSRSHLIEAIVKVNAFLKTQFISIPSENDFESTDYYNYLHLKFEELAGPGWDNPTRLVLIAPEYIKLAIRHINRFCHRLETRPYKIDPYMRIEFNSSLRNPLLEQDYELFELINEPGTVVLDYSTLGKTLFECFEDGLPPNYAGMKHQHHYCSNFKLNFLTDPDCYNKRQNFSQWVKVNKIVDIPKSALGEIKLGYFDSSLFEEVKKTNKIVKILIEQNE